MNKMHKHRDKRSDKLRIREEDLARELAEKARISNNEETKEDKKKKKKERQRQQKQQLQLEKEQQELLLKKQKQQQLGEEKRLEELRRIQANTLEQTMPAMVTIKRIKEDNGTNASTITIKLKGSTPEQDKLLYNIINGQNNNNNNSNNQQNSSQGNQKKKKISKGNLEEPIKKAVLLQHTVNVEMNNNCSTNTKKKKNKSETCSSNSSKELKVTLVVDAPVVQETKKLKNKNQKNVDLSSSGNNKRGNKKEMLFDKSNNGEPLDLPMLCLPPGITITKVNGPVINRNYKTTDLPSNHPNATTITNIPVSKSGVIVVDTEKLIKQSNPNSTSSSSSLPSAASKRRRRKKTKESITTKSSKSMSKNTNGQSMVTLKNPLFQNYQNPHPETTPDITDMNCQASIFKNDNGMVTIRSSRLQQSLNNGTPLQSAATDLKPIIGSDMPTPHIPPPSFPESNGSISTPFNAEEILSGLPGIEITKFDKCAVRIEDESKNPCQTAQVSIIPAHNGEKINFDKEEWQYDSNLIAKDEEDMDADAARELEAFKCFCQQSVPPKCKEKVAHLNVKDIVLKKKNDKNTV